RQWKDRPLSAPASVVAAVWPADGRSNSRLTSPATQDGSTKRARAGTSGRRLLGRRFSSTETRKPRLCGIRFCLHWLSAAQTTASSCRRLDLGRPSQPDFLAPAWPIETG